jgi:hypothetical protein
MHSQRCLQRLHAPYNCSTGAATQACSAETMHTLRRDYTAAAWHPRGAIHTRNTIHLRNSPLQTTAASL